LPETECPSRGEERDGEQENETREADGRLCGKFAQEFKNLSIFSQSASWCESRARCVAR
jgi:hypothetical protein